jgi:hypothetical protein
MNREPIKSVKDFHKFADRQRKSYKSWPNLLEAIEMFESECEPDSYPCILIWDIGEAGLEVDHEYIYPGDFDV